jgi:hypothetical protein
VKSNGVMSDRVRWGKSSRILPPYPVCLESDGVSLQEYHTCVLRCVVKNGGVSLHEYHLCVLRCDLKSAGVSF